MPSLRHRGGRSRRTPALECPSYHKRSELPRLSGYYPNLSAAQKDGVQQIKAKLKAASMTLSPSPEDEDLRILRFLRARKFDVNATFSMLKEHVEWESAEQICSLQLQSCAQLLPCPPEQFFEACPWWFQGTDRQARPLLWAQCGGVEVWRLLQLAPRDSVLRLHIWGCTQLERHLAQQSQIAGCNIETVVVIIDAAAWNLGLATKESFSLIQAVVEEAGKHFPERLGQMLVLNAPSVLSFAWKVISGFLDPVTRGKVQIFGHSDEWGPVLRELAEPSQVPARYGGLAADLSTAEGVATMTPPAAGADGAASSSSSISNSTSHRLVQETAGPTAPSGYGTATATWKRSSATGGGGAGFVGTAALSASNLTIISSQPSSHQRHQHRHRHRNNDPGSSSSSSSAKRSSADADPSRPARLGAVLGDLGRWLGESLTSSLPQLSLSAPDKDKDRDKDRARGRGRRWGGGGGDGRRRAESGESWQSGGGMSLSGVSDEEEEDSSFADDDEGDSSEHTAGSNGSSISDIMSISGSSTSTGTGTGTSVHDQEGGNVLHCRRENNVTPLLVEGAARGTGTGTGTGAGSEGAWMEARCWMFSTGTQTDVSSFDPQFRGAGAGAGVRKASCGARLAACLWLPGGRRGGSVGGSSVSTSSEVQRSGGRDKR